MQNRVVFFADILGFAGMAWKPGSLEAIDALSEMATVLSSEDQIARLVRSDVWTERYGLSDSLFLVAEEPRGTCAAAAQLFFNLAYIGLDAAAPVLIRGAITAGEARRTDPLFPESASANLVGKAVVEAVALERSGVKGPRLLVSEAVAGILEADREVGHWPLDRTENGVAEILWFLPASPSRDRIRLNGTMIGELCGAVSELFLRVGLDPEIGPQYAAYLRVALKSLLRLRQLSEEQARRALETAAFQDREQELVSRLRDGGLDDLLADLKSLLG